MDQVEISTDNIINSRRIDGATLRGLDMSKDGRRGIMGGLNPMVMFLLEKIQNHKNRLMSMMRMDRETLQKLNYLEKILRTYYNGC